MDTYENAFANMVAEKVDSINKAVTQLGVDTPILRTFIELGATKVRGGREKQGASNEAINTTIDSTL